jgi:hypothetical protein
MAASTMRNALKPSGGMIVVPYLMTLKFTAQIVAISSSATSANHTPGRARIVRGPGVTALSALSADGTCVVMRAAS